MKKSTLLKLWYTLLSLIIVLGLVTSVRVFTEGSGHLFHADDNMPWTLLIATYTFFVLTSTGATIIASLSTVFGYQRYDHMVKRAIYIGLITLIAGFVAMGLELGNPLNMLNYFLSPNFTSPIWWMGLFYMCLFVILTYKFWHIHTKNTHTTLTKVLAVMALVLEVGALSTLGAVFGLIEARPTFFGEYILAYFLFTALLSGISAILFFSLSYYAIVENGTPERLKRSFESLSKILGAVIAVTLLFSIWHMVIGIYSTRPEFDVIHYMMNSMYYKIEILIGLIIPLAMMIIPSIRQSAKGKLIAAILIFIGLGIGRMDMVMLGQIQPIVPRYSETSNIISYFPTFWEWVISVFALALMLMLYTLGEQFLKLETHKEKPKAD